jgi:hypothetical protein
MLARHRLNARLERLAMRKAKSSGGNHWRPAHAGATKNERWQVGCNQRGDRTQSQRENFGGIIDPIEEREAAIQKLAGRLKRRFLHG